MAQTQRLWHRTSIQTKKTIQGAAIKAIEATEERLLGQETLPMIAWERLTTGSCGHSVLRFGPDGQKPVMGKGVRHSHHAIPA